MNAGNLPLVDPMMVRKIIPLEGVTQMGFFGGVLVMTEYDVEPVGMATSRLPYDEPRVDCSRRIFEITTTMMMRGGPLAWTAFPSRRWLNFREGEDITGAPTPTEPLLYLGNPVIITADRRGIRVMRLPEFLIKSGPELGY